MTPKENLSRSKEVLGAAFRQGLHELGAAFYGPGTVAQHPEYGMVGTKTPGEVAAGMRGEPEARTPGDAPSPSATQLPSATLSPSEKSPEPREPDREITPPEPDLERD